MDDQIKAKLLLEYLDSLIKVQGNCSYSVERYEEIQSSIMKVLDELQMILLG